MTKKSKRTRNFTIISAILFIFFILPIFHDWANNFSIKLHFCDHSACFIYSLIWLAFAIIGYNYLRKKKKIKKNFITISIVVLVVGILLMNSVYCDLGGMHFGGILSQLNLKPAESDFEDRCIPGVDCPDDIVEVPIPPCIETDAGRDYITPGIILSGVNIEDTCMGDDILRERYCNNLTTYTSEDVSCSEYRDDYICEDGECVLNTTPTAPTPPVIGTETDCGDGVDNDGDGDIDCADSDCDYAFEDGGCGDFDYSCQHVSPYPECGGTCPTGEECIIYYAGDGTLDGGWCECMPSGETACGDSGSCDGWCLDGEICVSDSFGCFCEFDISGDCTDSDGGIDIYVGGYCLDYLDNNYIEYCGFEKGDENTLYEYYCLYGEATDVPTDCSALGLVCIEPYPDPAYCGEGEL